MAAIPTTYNEKENTWCGAKRSSIYDYNISVGKVIFNTMKNWPKNVCQVRANEISCCLLMEAKNCYSNA